MFITFEGIEGSGKTTQIRLLSDYLAQRGFDCIATREPGGTSIGEAIRRVFLHCDHNDMQPITELLLVTAARAQHIAQVVKPQLKAGKILLCDRYIDATVAYQGVAAGLGLETIMRSHELFNDSLMPDLTILIDCPVEIGLVRSRQRNHAAGLQKDEGRFEELDFTFHERVRQGYLEQARREPHRFEVVIDDGTPNDIHQRIAGIVLKRLTGAGHAL